MKILLLGEYSGVHDNLQLLLKERGHEVLFIHDGDSYKKIQNADKCISYKRIHFENKYINKIFNIFYLILDILGVKGVFQSRKYLIELDSLRGFDIVQLINTKPFGQFGAIANIIMLKVIMKNNNKIFLCALGDDYTWVKSCLTKKVKYSMFDNFKFKNLKHFIYSLNYVYGLGSRKLNKFVINNSKKIIPGLYDYYFAYQALGVNCSEIVPIAIEKTFQPILNIEYPIRIFHGWQLGKELRKGNLVFDEAIKRIVDKYGDKVIYEVVQNIPLVEYKTKFRDCHIFIDQCFSLDRGVNALLGMASGKVVFSGCEDEAVSYYNNGLENCLINARPDADEIFRKIDELILNKDLIKKISESGLKYIKENHNNSLVYSSYMGIWNE